MKGFRISIILLMSMVIFACTPKENQQVKKNQKVISNKVVKEVIKSVQDKYGDHAIFRIERGVNQVATLWTKKDGSIDNFRKFCISNFIISNDELDKVFHKISRNYEVLNGNLHRITVDLKVPLHLEGDEILTIDRMFGGYNPYANINKDFFNNKIAHYVLLNFPFYSLNEKEELGKEWTSKEWAYARLGDIFTSRIPAELQMKSSEIMTRADSYIAEYNIHMNQLVDTTGKKHFPKNMVLISHWGLRDELKSNYTGEDGLYKQKTIYSVMKRIINQSIPREIINSNKFEWNPRINKLFKEGKEIGFESEPNTRYEHLLNNFKARLALDKYNPGYPTYIQRAFDRNMELSQEEVEALFVELCSSPLVKETGKLIEKRLGRELEPFDIWYDGFKPRSNISSEELDEIVWKKYPNIEAFQNDLVNILKKLGFSNEKAEFISSRVQVDPSRGAGHALGAEMKSDKAHLRTRIPKGGMRYKAYNIATHEFGHNVEQTISLQDVDYYMMQGVPSTAFTEALAFIFQKRDLELLGIKDDNPNKHHLMTLDNFWSAYEIMGVSLVDMNVWKWLYEHPQATSAELKDAVITIAKDVWNKYYAEVFGSNNEPILAIYSHMIDNPLYLSAYPIGHLIDFQIEEHMVNKDFASEVERIYKQGRLVPQQWMSNAVGQKISNKPLFNATEKALKIIK